MIKRGLSILITVFTFSLCFSQEIETTRILFIFDGSNSMNAIWQKNTKIQVAKRLLEETLDDLKGLPNIEVGLRLYGHQTRILPGMQDCSDTELVVPFAPGDGNIDMVKSQIRGLVPKGTTPIARSLEYSAGDFPEDDKARNVIVLITDGVEACDEDPCAVSRALREKGIQLKPFVVGLGLDTSYLHQFGCIGKYLSVETEDSFESVINYVVSQALNNTSVQVNLNDMTGNPRETNVTMSFYEEKNGGLEYTYMHTLNFNQLPDTVSINPIHDYKLVVHTTPELVLEHIKLKPGEHNIIELDAPQGYLDLKIQGSSDKYNGIKCIVRKDGEMNTVNIQDFNYRHKYLAGTYDLEVLTLPRLYMEDVKIAQRKSATISIPQSGYLEVTKGDGPCQVFQIKDGQNIWVCNLEEESSQKITKLLPGKYKVVYRSNRSASTAHTMEKRIKITPNQTEKLTFY